MRFPPSRPDCNKRQCARGFPPTSWLWIGEKRSVTSSKPVPPLPTWSGLVLAHEPSSGPATLNVARRDGSDVCRHSSLLMKVKVSSLLASEFLAVPPDEEDHKERYNGCSGVDDQLPPVGEAERRPAHRPNGNDLEVGNKGHRTAGEVRYLTGKLRKSRDGPDGFFAAYPIGGRLDATSTRPGDGRAILIPKREPPARAGKSIANRSKSSSEGRSLRVDCRWYRACVRWATLGCANLPGECWIPVPLPPPECLPLASANFRKFTEITRA
jgi:hypothetical protein